MHHLAAAVTRQVCDVFRKQAPTPVRDALGPKFELLFRPVCRPWVSVIERLWKPLYDTVTRNHRPRSMRWLMGSVRWFMGACKPWSGIAHALARA